MLLSSTFFPVPSLYVAEVAERATSDAAASLRSLVVRHGTVKVMARCSIRGVDDGFKNVVVRSTA